MFQTLIRRSNDEHLYAWAQKLLHNQSKEYKAHYIGYGQFDFDQDPQLVRKIFAEGNNIIVFCFDYLVQEILDQIQKQVSDNNKINLVWIGAQKEPFTHKRIKSIFWPADMLLQINEYKQLGKIDKNPSNSRHWVSTSLGIRQHRIYMASLLKGLDLDSTGDLRIKTVSRMGPKAHNMSEELAKGNGLAPDETKTLIKYIEDKWQVSNKHLSEEAKTGYEKLITKKWWGSSIFTYSQYTALGDYHGSNDAGNFDKYLRHLYKDKTLEVVNETSHAHDPIFITEKFINGVFGMNFIIMNGPAGTVKVLEDLGWNSCRHIVNHDYDDISDPINRCEQAVKSNLRLFSDSEYCNKLWHENIEILEANRSWASNDLLGRVLKNFQDTPVI